MIYFSNYTIFSNYYEEYSNNFKLTYNCWKFDWQIAMKSAIS